MTAITHAIERNTDFVPRPGCSATGCDWDATTALERSIDGLQVWVYACAMHAGGVGILFDLVGASALDGLESSAFVDDDAAGSAMAAFVHNVGATMARYQRDVALERAESADAQSGGNHG